MPGSPVIDDTRTWPMSWRLGILLNVSFYNMMGNFFTAGITPLYGLLTQDLSRSVEDISKLSTYALLMLGVGNLWAIQALQYVGKRYTIILSMTIFLASNIWAAKADSYESLLASRFVGGASGGTVEAIAPMIISETFPRHQLAKAMVVYVGFLAAGSALGPIVAGVIASNLKNWRWYFGVSSITIGANLLCCLLILPETTYNVSIGESSTPLQSSVELVSKSSTCGHENESTISPEPPSKSLASIWVDRSFFSRLSSVQPKKNIAQITIQQFLVLFAPPVFATAIVFGLNIGWTVLTSIVLSNFYQQPPYLWEAWQIGLLNLGPLVGLAVGIPIGGALADFLLQRARKTGKEYDPSCRLPAVVVGALISPVGCLVIGLSLKNNHHWTAIAVGWGMLGFGLTASANVLLTYCVDCFAAYAGHIGAVLNALKNVIAFGVSFASIDWYYEVGPAVQFGTMAALLVVSYSIVPFLYLYSGSLRLLSRRLIEI